MNRLSSIRRLVAMTAIALALVLVGASAALALTVVHRNGGSVKAVIMTSDPNAETTTGTAVNKFTNLTTNVVVPANTHGTFLITLTATSSCADSVPGSSCYVAVFVDNTQATPTGFIWDQSNGSFASLAAH